MKKLFLIFLLCPIVILQAQNPRFIDFSSMQKPNTPIVTVVGSFAAFSTNTGTASASQSVTASGSSLTANGSVSFPTGYEISIAGGAYTPTSPQSITQSAGIFTGQPVTVAIRLAAADAPGSYAGNVVFSSTGANPITLTVSGTVNALGSRSSHWRTITVPNANVSGGSDLTAFPMTFQGTLTYLKTVANGGEVQNSSGFDILFAMDNAGATLCKWEIESYNASTGAITVHVRVPTLSASANTVIYLIYDSSSITTFQGGSAGSVWDANYQRVWHMNETLTGASQTVHDATTNAGNMTSFGSWTSAQAVAAQVGTGLKILNSNSTHLGYTALHLNSTYTIEGWFNATSATIDGNTYTWDSDTAVWQNEMAYGDAPGYVGLFNQAGNKVQDTAQTPANVWRYFVFTRNGTTWNMYRNGIFVATSTQGVNLMLNSMGFDNGTTSNDFICDELRISNIVRTQGWIVTQYNNQNNPPGFYTIGVEN